MPADRRYRRTVDTEQFDARRRALRSITLTRAYPAAPGGR